MAASGCAQAALAVTAATSETSRHICQLEAASRPGGRFSLRLIQFLLSVANLDLKVVSILVCQIMMS